MKPLTHPELSILGLIAEAPKHAHSRPLPWHVEARFDHSLTAMQCELDWVADTIQTLKKEEGQHEQN